MKMIKKQYYKPSILLIQAESVMAAATTGNLPIGGGDPSEKWDVSKKTGSSWTWTDDEGNDNSWTNQ